MEAFLIDKSDIRIIRKVSLMQTPLREGQVRFKVEKAGLTANNITYAVLGDRFRYWNFFPHKDGGMLPVWGYAEIVESDNKLMKVGARYYGYFPLAEELIVQPVRINDYGFVDGTEHRQSLPQVYNYYERAESNGISTELEDAYMTFQPLFATSFLLVHYFMDNECFGVDDVIVTSASSKTAMAFAAVLRQMNKSISITGITSSRNVDFCLSSGLYTEIKSYDESDTLQSEGCVIVDIAGNRPLLAELQTQLASALKKCITVGLSHWDQSTDEVKLPFKSDLFFAPDHAVQKQKDWGGKAFKMKLNASMIPFLKLSLEILNFNYHKDILTTYQNLLQGRVLPDECLIIEV